LHSDRHESLHQIEGDEMLRCSTSPYPTRHAFVVQFAAHTALDAKDLAGRVEHVVSGQATQFHSLQALFEFVVEVLQAVHASEDEGNLFPGHADAE